MREAALCLGPGILEGVATNAAWRSSLFSEKAVLAFFFIGLKKFIASLARERFEVLH